MGFTAGLYKAKRYNQNISVNDIHAIESYMSYCSNSWAIENYPSFQSYAEAMNCKALPNDEDCIKFYQTAAKPNEFNQMSITDEIETWCSDAGEFDKWLCEIAKRPQKETSVEITKESAINILKKCREELKKYQLQPVVIKSAFKENEDESILSVPCDGIEVENSDGYLKRVYSTEVEMAGIFIPKEYYPYEWNYNALERLEEVMINLLIYTDFESEIVFYESGW